MKTALFFGSFNPIHNGHLSIAEYVLEHTDIEELWFVVSPHNPLKEASDLAPEEHRLEMVRLSTAKYHPRIQVCDVEMQMPRPSYTIDTVNFLKSKYPHREYAILMGADSLDTIEKWKNFKDLLDNNRILVYPRPKSNLLILKEKYNVEVVDAPLLDISSTFIRDSVRAGKNVSFYMPHEVNLYLVKNKLYLYI